MPRVYTREERIEWMKGLPANPAGAAMILETEDRRLVIVKASYKKYWTLPGGVVDQGESPLKAAIREVKEEVGLSIEPENVEFVGMVYRYSEAVDLYQFIFRSVITKKQADSIVTQQTEIEAYALETADEITSAVRHYANPITIWASNAVFPAYSEEAMEVA